MGWLKTHFDKIILAVLPIPFIGSCFFNCLTFFMDGHQHGWLRSGITLGMQAIALCLILIELVRLWIHEPANRDFLKRSIWILAVFFAVMVLALVETPWKYSAICYTSLFPRIVETMSL